MQNILHRSKPSLSKLFIFLVYAIALTPTALMISEHYSKVDNPGVISMLGIALSLIVGIAFFSWLYKKSAQLPVQNFINEKKFGFSGSGIYHYYCAKSYILFYCIHSELL